MFAQKGCDESGGAYFEKEREGQQSKQASTHSSRDNL